MSGTISDQLLKKLATGGSDLVKLRRDIGCRPAELANALWALRGDDMVDFDTLDLTHKGRAKANALLGVSNQSQPDTQGASGTARKAPGAASSGAAERGSASAPPSPDSVPNAASQGATSPRPGWTRTRSPADVIRRISAEMDLADPRKGMAAMVQHWPEAARRMEALAASRSTTLYALIGQALAAGVDLIEARPSA